MWQGRPFPPLAWSFAPYPTEELLVASVSKQALLEGDSLRVLLNAEEPPVAKETPRDGRDKG